MKPKFITVSYAWQLVISNNDIEGMWCLVPVERN